ncbi:hypothetical protein HRI_002297000 [Hibiscus trionum]|uniref:Uncharacterized protein n=1 Tax=Hibiscus trionum TaxID=183268 RepID=A0A9W7I085_HIBTR|nr:hypothetical protein HRI_002297000 [Hibiscus trionum]
MAAGRLKPCPKFYLPFFLLQWLLSLGLTQAQQGYVNNQQPACEDASKDNNITRGFSCNAHRASRTHIYRQEKQGSARQGSPADHKNHPSRWATWKRNNTLPLRRYR